MSDNSKTSTDMTLIIERAMEQNPHAGELLKAFGPVVIRQRQLVKAAPLKPLDYSLVDKTKLKAGVPVIRQMNLLGENVNLKEIALALAQAVKEGMPALTEGLDRLSDLIRQDKINPVDYFDASNAGENKSAKRWESDLKISPSNASFLMNLVSRVVLEQRSRELISALGAFEWEKGYCPVCGEFPAIALIEEQGGKRFLHCSSCGQAWRFTRVVCPYCDNEAQQGMDYFYVENRTQESAFVCEKCKKYLVTLYRAGNLHERDMDISAISLVHLDMIMQEKGYSPMTICHWNILD